MGQEIDAQSASADHAQRTQQTLRTILDLQEPVVSAV
jgi:hypothetical protein